jgi:diguanylate cyclase (GGDEF)-like protein/PAS domain S-box-containing protein
MTLSVMSVLADGTIYSLFQPIVNLDTGDVVAYEALARGPKGPFERPDQLFDAARREDCLEELDGACRVAAFRGAIEQDLLAPLTLFVNVEPDALDSAPLNDLLAIAENAPGRLRVVIEITERALAVRPANLLSTVARIRELGWGVALDDVGADSMSLAFMPLLRPDVVKLDLRLVQERPGAEVAEIMNAVNSYAERTGALILAEGIETEQHLKIAQALGARLGQGWMFGRPSPGAAPHYGVAQLKLPTAPVVVDSTDSPFACLPDDVPLRRSPKALLIELSKQLEREAMRHGETTVVAATFQKARHFTPATAQRYRDLVQRTGFVCALGEELATEPVPGVRGAALDPDDPVCGEWDLAVIGPHFAAALLARDLGDGGPDLERTFEYALTYRRDTVVAATSALLARVTPKAVSSPPVAHSTLDRPTALENASGAIASRYAPELPDVAAVLERASRSEQPLLNRALDAATSGVTIADLALPDAPIVYANRAFEQLSGFRLDQVLGRNCRFLQGPETDTAAINRMRQAIRDGSECRETLLNYRGEQRTPWWNEVFLAPVKDENGQVLQYIGVQNDVTARVEAERALMREKDRSQGYLARLEQLAFEDPLTGLANRRRLQERMEVALWDARGADSSVALLFVDLNNFKEVNDRLGHVVGDELLVAVGHRLKSRLRRSDMLVRLGGDEFLIALPGLDPDTAAAEAEAVARQLKAAVSQPLMLTGRAETISASIGISCFPADGDDFSSLLHCADLRMYATKTAQREKV